MPLSQWVVADNGIADSVMGRGEEHLKLIEQALQVKLTARGNVIAVKGEEDAQRVCLEVLDLLAQWAGAGQTIRTNTVETALIAVNEGTQREFLHLLTENVYTTTQGKAVRPRTLGQQGYIEAIRHATLVLGLGPAGTGKTYLAMAMAVNALKAHEVEKIILTRPAVEAGEKLGFLPGDLEEKINPYLRPLYDALFEFLGQEAVDKYRDRGLIEIAPLAYMRGRTLNNSFIILDEAQNTTYEQMKMFLTRLGYGSKMVVTGDESQVDLPKGERSGLALSARVLEHVPAVKIVRLGNRDVVRNPLVADIIEAYRQFEDNQGAGDNERQSKRS
ncbi:MAG: PhoH family protein [Firmicutes bacterium]|nr:PhoH family protein [Bacillota bacterium]